MEVLIIEPHEGKLDSCKLALLNVRFRRTEAEFADLLPVGIRWLSLADARDLQHLGAQIALRTGARGKTGEPACGA